MKNRKIHNETKIPFLLNPINPGWWTVTPFCCIPLGQIGAIKDTLTNNRQYHQTYCRFAVGGKTMPTNDCIAVANLQYFMP